MFYVACKGYHDKNPGQAGRVSHGWRSSTESPGQGLRGVPVAFPPRIFYYVLFLRTVERETATT